ncbi:MAG: A24 family peptidase [Litorimonas sp.]
MFNDPLIWIAGVGLLGTLLCLSVIDAREFRLPNILTFPLIAAGLIYNFISSVDFYPYLLGAVIAYAAFWLIEHGYRLIRKTDGLGRGDAKLLAAGGAWCAWSALPFIVLIGSASALIWLVLTHTSRPQTQGIRLPFGPFLSFAIMAVWISQNIA